MKKNRNQRRHVRRDRIVNPRSQIRNNPEEVIVNLNLGCQALLPLSSASTVVFTNVNDPQTTVLDWVVRSSGFLTYRVVGFDIWLAPTAATAGTATPLRQWVSAIVEDSIGGSPNPSSANAVLELPQSQVRPMDTSNPLYRRHIRWRCRDLNALIYENVTAAPSLRTVKAFASVLGASAVTGWNIQMSGRLHVEFKGIVAL